MLSKRTAQNSPGGTSQSQSIGSETRSLMGMLNVRPSSLGAPAGHSERVAAYALAVGKHLDLPQKALNSLKSAAILHDIGKVGISSQIVDKLGRLTEREFEIMRLHSTVAIRMLERVEGLKDSLPMIKHHHERFDGKGYPDGLAEHDIPLGARIIALAETFDILVSDVPWRDAVTLDRAIQELQGGSGTQFDPMVVEAFMSVLKAGDVELPEDLAEQLTHTRLPRTH